MHDVTVTGIDDYINKLKQGPLLTWKHWYYRGHADESYALKPSLGRWKKRLSRADEQSMLTRFRNMSIPYMDPALRDLNDAELLAVARHHGMATRLMDWSFSPLTALYFAVSYRADRHGPRTKRAAVVAHMSPENIKYANHQEASDLPWETHAPVVRMRANPHTPRITAQGGIFTVHEDPWADMSSNLPNGHQLVRYIFEPQAADTAAKTLSHLGVNGATIYPDLHGVCEHVNWAFSEL